MALSGHGPESWGEDDLQWAIIDMMNLRALLEAPRRDGFPQISTRSWHMQYGAAVFDEDGSVNHIVGIWSLAGDGAEAMGARAL